MKVPTRVTIALDAKSAELFEKLKKETKLSQSEIFRNALRIYAEHSKHRSIEREKLDLYIDMLAGGEHIILDVDHWQQFLRLIEECPAQEKFWEDHRRVARSHAEQLQGKIKSPRDVIMRLEACNFFTLSTPSENEFTLVFGSDTAKKFVKIFLEEVFEGMGFDAEIKEDLTKLRIRVTD
ncbi:MAG: CopG family transcriptional regulator [Euryarchaeota archaeon]|nr:CopG family transcriptional regulator [Euryarchaeota archaeon]